jgi:hypothetical protein
VKELVLDGVNGCRVKLFDPQPADGGEIWSYRVSLQMSDGHLEEVPSISQIVKDAAAGRQSVIDQALKDSGSRS